MTKSRHYLILVAATLIFTIAAGMAVMERYSHIGADYLDIVMWPDFEEQKAAAAQIRLVTPDGMATFRKTEEGWLYEEQANFPLIGSKITELLDSVAAFTLVEAKTAREDRLYRLDLLMPDPEAEQKEGMGRHLVIEDAAGTVLVDMVIGKNNNTLGEGAARGGSYLRYTDESQSYLASGRLKRPDRLIDFIPSRDTDHPQLDRSLVNIRNTDLLAVLALDGEGGLLFHMGRNLDEEEEWIEIYSGAEAGDQPERGSPGTRLFSLLSGLRAEQFMVREDLPQKPWRTFSMTARMPAETEAMEDEGKVSPAQLNLILTVYEIGEELWARLEADIRENPHPEAEALLENLKSKLEGRAFRLDRNKAEQVRIDPDALASAK